MQNYLILQSLTTYIKDNNFLPVTDFVHNNSWTNVDQEKLFKENLKKQSVDWYYRSNTVNYIVNSNGYRTKEFKDIDWKNSIVLFGGSDLFGVGLDERHTLSSQLESILDIPVINMGSSGTSITYNLHNSVILSNGYPTPKAVVQLWPNYDRCVYYHKRSVENLGSWNFSKNNYMDLWNQDTTNAKINAIMARTIFRQIWKDRASIFEGSFNHRSAKLLECQPLYNPPLIGNFYINYYKDLARDLTHPGIETQKEAAKIIAENLKL